MDDARNKLLLQLTGQEFVDLLREGLGLSMLGYDEPQPMEVKKQFMVCKDYVISLVVAHQRQLELKRAVLLMLPLAKQERLL